LLSKFEVRRVGAEEADGGLVVEEDSAFWRCFTKEEERLFDEDEENEDATGL